MEQSAVEAQHSADHKRLNVAEEIGAGKVRESRDRYIKIAQRPLSLTFDRIVTGAPNDDGDEALDERKKDLDAIKGAHLIDQPILLFPLI